jgi:thiol-disulfide isomerase/thioredoxin
MKYLLVVLIFSLFQTLTSLQHQVIEITDLTFDNMMISKPFLVVLYHVPWCGYCKELDPIFERTASLFSSRDITTIQFGKVDGTTNHRLINEYGIQKFPTIKMYGFGKVVEYIGIRGENELFTWVNIQMNNGPKELNTPEELKQLIIKKDVLICYFGKMLTYDFLFFESIAKALAKEYEFFYCESEECRSEFEAQENSYVIFKSFEEKRHDFMIESNVQKMINIIDSYSNPLLMKLNDNTINFIFEKNYPCLLIVKDNNFTHSEEAVKTICREKRVKS